MLDPNDTKAIAAELERIGRRIADLNRRLDEIDAGCDDIEQQAGAIGDAAAWLVEFSKTAVGVTDES
jgi:hypothetical protein